VGCNTFRSRTSIIRFKFRDLIYFSLIFFRSNRIIILSLVSFGHSLSNLGGFCVISPATPFIRSGEGLSTANRPEDSIVALPLIIRNLGGGVVFDNQLILNSQLKKDKLAFKQNKDYKIKNKK
jgi:hypothetical protein